MSLYISHSFEHTTIPPANSKHYNTPFSRWAPAHIVNSTPCKTFQISGTPPSLLRHHHRETPHSTQNKSIISVTGFSSEHPTPSGKTSLTYVCTTRPRAKTTSPINPHGRLSRRVWKAETRLRPTLLQRTRGRARVY